MRLAGRVVDGKQPGGRKTIGIGRYQNAEHADNRGCADDRRNDSSHSCISSQGVPSYCGFRGVAAALVAGVGAVLPGALVCTGSGLSSRVAITAAGVADQFSSPAISM